MLKSKYHLSALTDSAMLQNFTSVGILVLLSDVMVLLKPWDIFNGNCR